jgi:hypothetical protein
MLRNETTPDQELTETSTAVAEPPATETRSDGPSFAERVGQRKWTPTPDPFGIATDYQAGVSLFESKRDRRVAIKFGDGRPEDKPSQAVIDKMKEAGYRWHPSQRMRQATAGTPPREYGRTRSGLNRRWALASKPNGFTRTYAT